MIDRKETRDFPSFTGRGGLFAVAALCIIVCSSLASAQENAPCKQIRTACTQAGFKQGGAKDGLGLIADCMRPILQGVRQRAKASKPLPRIDSTLVAACNAENPNFRQREPSPSRSPDGIEAFRNGATGLENEAADAPLRTAGVPGPSANAPGTARRRPNFVFILTDDLSWNLVQFMPHVVKMQNEGVTFSRYFVTDSLCCPSRSSILTGRYPHSTGVFKNKGPDGGYSSFVAHGNEATTFATALSAAGYRTAMLGKYLNGYRPERHKAAAGWSEWDVAGNGYPEFNYDLNQNGTVVHHDGKPTDYLTDILSKAAVSFIKESTETPFMIEVATFAPHRPYTPAPRDADAFPGLTAPRTAAFNATPGADAPAWLRTHPALSNDDIAQIDKEFRKRAQSVLAVDKMIEELQTAVAAIGQTDNTYFIFSSDNGYHMGEYRLMPGKLTAYDSDIHVPLVMTGPGIAAGGSVGEISENIDLCPTFTELADAASSPNVDGRSLAPFLFGKKVGDWPSVALIEHRGPVRGAADPDKPVPRGGNPTSYEAIRTPTVLYVEYADGEKEYHSLTVDPDEVHNTYSLLSSEEKASLHETVARMQVCHGPQNCLASKHVVKNAMQQ